MDIIGYAELLRTFVVLVCNMCICCCCYYIAKMCLVENMHRFCADYLNCTVSGITLYCIAELLWGLCLNCCEQSWYLWKGNYVQCCKYSVILLIV